MAEGGIARRLVSFAYIFVGFIRGGLSLVNIVASTFFGAILPDHQWQIPPLSAR